MFKVLYVFDNKDQTLNQVNISSYQQNNVGINAGTFSSIEQLLTEKYGTPTYKKANKNVSWKLPNTLIELSHAYIPEIITQVILTYEPVKSNIDASKDL